MTKKQLTPTLWAYVPETKADKYMLVRWLHTTNERSFATPSDDGRIRWQILFWGDDVREVEVYVVDRQNEGVVDIVLVDDDYMPFREMFAAWLDIETEHAVRSVTEPKVLPLVDWPDISWGDSRCTQHSTTLVDEVIETMDSPDLLEEIFRDIPTESEVAQ